jgi:hypothetical protein
MDLKYPEVKTSYDFEGLSLLDLLKLGNEKERNIAYGA